MKSESISDINISQQEFIQESSESFSRNINSEVETGEQKGDEVFEAQKASHKNDLSISTVHRHMAPANHAINAGHITSKDKPALKQGMGIAPKLHEEKVVEEMDLVLEEVSKDMQSHDDVELHYESDAFQKKALEKVVAAAQSETTDSKLSENELKQSEYALEKTPDRLSDEQLIALSGIDFDTAIKHAENGKTTNKLEFEDASADLEPSAEAPGKDVPKPTQALDESNKAEGLSNLPKPSPFVRGH